MTTVLLVHGAWHGAWCWHKVLDGLRARGVPAQALDLPLTGLVDDAAAVRSALEGINDDVVLCGHSYGGSVISRATSPEAPTQGAAHLVYLCAFMWPEADDAVAMLATHGADVVPALRQTADGLTVDDDSLVPVFYADCSDDDVALARRSLRPMPLGLAAPTPVRPGYETIPSTYVLCEHDRAIPASLQRIFAGNAGRTVELPTSHSPFFSAPDRVVDVLAGLAL